MPNPDTLTMVLNSSLPGRLVIRNTRQDSIPKEESRDQRDIMRGKECILFINIAKYWHCHLFVTFVFALHLMRFTKW